MASLGSQLLGRSLIGPRITWKPARAKRGSVPKYALSSPVRSDPTLGYASTAGAPFSPAYSALPPESARLQCLVPAILAHSDAGNHPNVLFVDTRRSAGTIYAGQFMAWGHSNSTNGLAILECKQPRSVGTGSQPSHRCPATLIDSTRAGQFAHVAVGPGAGARTSMWCPNPRRTMPRWSRLSSVKGLKLIVIIPLARPLDSH